CRDREKRTSASVPAPRAARGAREQWRRGVSIGDALAEARRQAGLTTTQVREYDATQSAPQAITAADVFEPSTPIKLRERRRLNWSLALAVVLLAVIGLGVYHPGNREPENTTARPPAQ